MQRIWTRALRHEAPIDRPSAPSFRLQDYGVAHIRHYIILLQEMPNMYTAGLEEEKDERRMSVNLRFGSGRGKAFPEMCNPTYLR